MVKKEESKEILNIEKDMEELISKLDDKETENIVKEFYKSVAKFNNYSFNNIWLLNSQAKQRGINLSYVASFKEWSQMDVMVNKGRKALNIFAPKQNYEIKRDEENKPILIDGKYQYVLDENNQKIKTSVSFLLVPVFDATQTNALESGKIKTLTYRNQDETISNEMLNNLYKEVQDKYNIKIEEKKLEPNLGGYYQKNKNLIVINNHSLKSTNSKVGTLFHELGHHLLHGQDNYKDIHLDTGQKEGERESVSYIISKFLDIEQKSELYLKSWDRNASNMKEHLESIVRASKEIFKTIDFKEIFEKEFKRQELTKVYLNTLIEDKSVSIKSEHNLSLQA